jgi:hypothetical protein
VTLSYGYKQVPDERIMVYERGPLKFHPCPLACLKFLRDEARGQQFVIGVCTHHQIDTL